MTAKGRQKMDAMVAQHSYKTMEKNQTIFTPRHHKTGERARMFITGAESQSYKEKNAWSIVHDIASGREIMVKRASCGLGCKCDAIYKEIGE